MTGVEGELEHTIDVASLVADLIVMSLERNGV